MAKPLNSPGSLAASKWLLWNKPIKENKWHVYMTTFMVEGQYLCQILAKSEELNTTKNQFMAIGGFFMGRYKIFLKTKSSLIRPLSIVGVVSLSVFDFCISSPGPTINRICCTMFIHISEIFEYEWISILCFVWFYYFSGVLCHFEGKCQGVIIRESFTVDEDECLKLCKEEKQCAWMSYFEDLKNCLLLEDCATLGES